MKIAVIAGTIGGIVGFRLDMMLAFKSRGHEVVAVSALEKPSLKKILDEHNIRFKQINVDRKSVNPFKEFSLVREIKSFLKAERFDAVIAFTPKMATYATIAAMLAGVKKRIAVFTGLGYAFAQNSLWGLMRRIPFVFIYGLGMRCASNVIFQNIDDKKTAEKLLMTAASKSAIMNGSGVNLEKFPYSTPPENKIVFTFVGRLIKDKGIHEFLYASKKIKELQPDVKIVILGAPDNNPSSIDENEFNKIKNDGKIECMGFVSDVVKYITETSVAVLPSYREGCPHSMLEAMSIGRALILADAPGTRVPLALTEKGKRQQKMGATVIEGENGFLVRPRDGDAIVDAMKCFIENPALITSMGYKSRKLAEEKFDVDKVNAFLLSILES